jgi:hypothetical protein
MWVAITSFYAKSYCCCLLFTVCCLLSTVYCLLSTVCCLLFAVCCLLFAVCCLLFAVCCLLWQMQPNTPKPGCSVAAWSCHITHRIMFVLHSLWHVVHMHPPDENISFVLPQHHWLATTILLCINYPLIHKLSSHA